MFAYFLQVGLFCPVYFTLLFLEGQFNAFKQMSSANLDVQSICTVARSGRKASLVRVDPMYLNGFLVSDGSAIIFGRTSRRSDDVGNSRGSPW